MGDTSFKEEWYGDITGSLALEGSISGIPIAERAVMEEVVVLGYPCGVLDTLVQR